MTTEIDPPFSFSVSPIGATPRIIRMVLILMILGIVLLLFIYLPIKTFPADDALILFRYAENLAHTGVITYNPGETPVEGATDFLWMILLAGFHVCDFNTWSAALFLSLLSLFGTVFLLYRLLTIRNKAIFLVLIIFFLVLETTFSAIQGFSTLFFGFFIMLTLYFNHENKPPLLYISALIASLVRPDGLVFVCPIMLHNLYRNRANVYQSVIQCIVIFFIPAIAYFIWRWNYFGLFFPLPFYIKNTYELINVESLIVNIKFNLLYFVILIILMIYLLLKRERIHIRNIIFFLLLWLPPFLFYSKVTLLQNVFHRFQYPFVIINIFMLISIVKNYKIKYQYFVLCLMTILCISAPQIYRAFLTTWYSQYAQLYYIAKTISDKSIDALFLTTEAGVVPYYTRWKTIDAFGLNTPDFTKTVISSEDVRAIKPDVVLINHMWDLYKFVDEGKEFSDFRSKSWPGIIKNIYKGLDSKEYDMFLIPVYNIFRLKNDLLFQLPQLDSVFELSHDKMFYGIFIRNKFHYSQELKDIIISHNAVTYDTFKNIVRPQIEKQIKESNLFPDLFPPD